MGEKTSQMRAVEARDPEGREIREILAAAYREQGTVLRAALSLGISQGAFSNWMHMLGGRIESELVFVWGATVGAGADERREARR